MSSEDNKALLKLFGQEFPRYQTANQAWTQEEFNEIMMYKPKKRTFSYRLTFRLSQFCMSLLPVLVWLPRYSVNKNLLRDILAGLTIAVIQIPQGMAYAALGGVNPIIGLYMAIFPIFIYFLLGTSHHISLGSFSVICLMSSYPIAKYSTSNKEATNTDGQALDSTTYTPVQVAAVISITVGLMQVIMGICKIGSISAFMSESFVSGFTSASAVLVITSQLHHVIGVDIKQYHGIFNIIYRYNSLIGALPKTNYVALALSLSVILILTIYSDVIEPNLNIPIPIPMEIFVLIVGIILSDSLKLRDRYAINVIGAIPSGFPSPVLPCFRLIENILLDCLTIAIVSFSMNISLASMFAIKDDYIINANQEMLALGCSNIIGSLFYCLPVGASIARSMVQYKCGGRTQLASIFSSLFLLMIILYSTTFLSSLPYSILAAIVIKSLRSMVLQVLDLPRVWKLSLFDGIIWSSTFISVILINIETGLVIGLSLAWFSIVFMNQKVSISLLGKVMNTNLYLELERYGVASPLPGFIIIQVTAGLHFANIHFAITKIETLIANTLNRQCAPERTQPITLVMDMSGVSFVDPQSLHVLQGLIERWQRKEIKFCFANCSVRVYEIMKRCDFIKVVTEQAYFPTIHDAVVYTLNTMQRN